MRRDVGDDEREIFTRTRFILIGTETRDRGKKFAKITKLEKSIISSLRNEVL